MHKSTTGYAFRCEWQTILIFPTVMHLCQYPLDAVFIRGNCQTILASYNQIKRNMSIPLFIWRLEVVLFRFRSQDLRPECRAVMREQCGCPPCAVMDHVFRTVLAERKGVASMLALTVPRSPDDWQHDFFLFRHSKNGRASRWTGELRRFVAWTEVMGRTECLFTS